MRKRISSSVVPSTIKIPQSIKKVYFSGSKEEISSRLPFDARFEGAGLVAVVAGGVKNLKIGTPAAIMTFGSYAEFAMVVVNIVIKDEKGISQ
ncbi:ARP protein [Tanacetum coccineum]